MTPTTMPTPIGVGDALRQSELRPAMRSAAAPSVAPENAPDSTPISVMPICTVERNLPGSEASASARREPVTPFSTRAASRAGRDETMASSDIDEQAVDDDQDRDDPEFEIEHACAFLIGIAHKASIPDFPASPGGGAS